MRPQRCLVGNHPMTLKSGEWACHECAKLKGKDTARCSNDHLKPKGKQCDTCRLYIARPFLKDFYFRGTAECIHGHELTMETVSWTQQSFVCTACAAAKQRRAQEGKAGGRAYDELDWVLVLQFVEARGVTVGHRSDRDCDRIIPYPSEHLTEAEKWVIRCTQQVWEHECIQQKAQEWVKFGAQNGWRELTLYDVLREISSEEYSEGRLLLLPSSTISTEGIGRSSEVCYSS